MTKLFKATKRVPFCTAAQLNKFILGLVDAWERNERTMEEVHDKCELLMKDAAEGTLRIDDKAVYAKTLGAKLKELGCFMTDAPSKVPEDSPYA
jgi:hypothetical protein